MYDTWVGSVFGAS